MKIAYVFYDRPGYRAGPLVNAIRLLPELSRRGHEVHALIQVLDGTWSPQATILDQKGIQTYVGTRIGSTESHIQWMLKALVEIDPDIFIPNLSVAACFAARWLRDAGIPSIATYRSDDDYYNDLIKQFVFGPKVWAVEGLVSVSHSAHERILSRRPPATQLQVIPSGVPIPSSQADQGKPNLHIVYVGRLVQKQKRVLDLIRSLSAALQKLPDASATLIGHGVVPEDEQKVDALINTLGMKSRIRRMGTVSPEKLQKVLVDCHVAILLSDYEGVPGALMDAMACGLVPLSLDSVPGCRELVIDGVTGLLVKDRGQDVVQALQRLAEDPALRARLGTNARRHIREKYSLAIAADRWERFMNDVRHQNVRRKGRIKISKRYRLPKVLPGLAMEDQRLPSWPLWKRAFTSLKRRLEPLKRSVP